MNDRIIPPRPSPVACVLAELAFAARAFNDKEHTSEADALAADLCEAEDRFVFEPVRSTSDAIFKLEYVAADEELDPVHEDLIRGVLAYLRSQVTA